MTQSYQSSSRASNRTRPADLKPRNPLARLALRQGGRNLYADGAIQPRREDGAQP